MRPDPDDLSTWPIEWLVYVDLNKVEEVTTLSPSTQKRRYPHLIKQLSPRRVAMRLGHAIMIGTAKNL